MEDPIKLYKLYHELFHIYIRCDRAGDNEEPTPFMIIRILYDCKVIYAIIYRVVPMMKY